LCQISSIHSLYSRLLKVSYLQTLCCGFLLPTGRRKFAVSAHFLLVSVQSHPSVVQNGLAPIYVTLHGCKNGLVSIYTDAKRLRIIARPLCSVVSYLRNEAGDNCTVILLPWQASARSRRGVSRRANGSGRASLGGVSILYSCNKTV